jgi:hypothetical protein
VVTAGSNNMADTTMNIKNSLKRKKCSIPSAKGSGGGAGRQVWIERPRIGPALVPIGMVFVFFVLSCVSVGQENRNSSSSYAPVSKGEKSGALLGDLELPASHRIPLTFRKAVERREQMDGYASRAYKFSAIKGAQPTRPEQRRRNSRRFVQVVSPKFPSSVIKFRQGVEATRDHVIGYRAPILDASTDLRNPFLASEKLSPEQRAAAALIADSLAERGLLQTLAEVIEILGTSKSLNRPIELRRQLWQLGFPVDLLDFFSLSADQTAKSENGDVIVEIARELVSGKRPSELREKLESASFEFSATNPQYQGTIESGDHSIGLVRYQLGGSADQGVLSGGSIDVATQLFQALPRSTFLVTAPEFAFENMLWMARFHWELRRPAQLTLISDPSHVSPWAQDNGKGGYLKHGSDRPAWATLTPRYASRNEYPTELAPIESFLMDGLARSGHGVVQSPLLFQGGNLFLVREPQRDETLLLLGEAAVYRNIQLGLSRDQTLEAFRVEFAVDRCVVLPMVSFHLDFDLTCRIVDGRLIAFVNDSDAASRLILSLGLEAFGRADLINENVVKSIKKELASGRSETAIKTLRGIAKRLANDESKQAELVNSLFAKAREDSARRNFQIFNTALDITESWSIDSFRDGTESPSTTHLKNLRQLVEAERSLKSELRKRGFSVVEVPSLPGVFASVNYLNGLQDKSAYLMPTIGGFYTGLDQAAGRVFQQSLGTGTRVTPILCSDLMQHNGSLRCAASVYRQL